MKYQKYALLMSGAVFFSAGIYAAPEGASLSVLVQEAEQKGELPGPILALMLAQGNALEKATEVTVATSSSGTYAQGFTYHAICMASSQEQAQRVHDVAIGSATDKYKIGVTAEARYSLRQFKENGCAAKDGTRKEMVKAEAVKSESVEKEEPNLVAEESVTEERVVEVDPNALEVEELPVDIIDEVTLDSEALVVTLEPITIGAVTGTVAGGASSSQ